MHLLALPYPGRGHINGMMYLCTHISSLRPDILITVVVTEEWQGFIADEPSGARPLPPSVRLVSIPNVIPSELDRAADFAGFVEAVNTKMEAPLEELLDRRLEPKEVSCIVADTYLPWAVGFCRRRNIPVASLWPMSPSMLCLLELLLSDPNRFPLHHISGTAYIPNPSSSGHDIYFHFRPASPLINMRMRIDIDYSKSLKH